jgi:hypothetical protein
MEFCDWIVALYCLGAGAGVLGFWIQRLAAGRVPKGDPVMRHHLAAEFTTAAGLFAGGIGTIWSPRHGVSVALVGLGLGLLFYASIQSPPFYPEERLVRVSLWGTLVTAALALILRLVTL